MNLINLLYPESLTECYQRLNDLPGFVLLESRDYTQGRYDILSAVPYKRLEISKNSNALTEVYEDIQKELSKLTSTLDKSIPFQGGAIGYFSYDFAAELAGLKTQTRINSEDLPVVSLGFYDWGIVVDHLLKKAYLVYQKKTSVIDEVLERWNESYAMIDVRFQVSSFNSFISKEEYKEIFFNIYQDIQQGRAYQVNFTQPFYAVYEGKPWDIYANICLANPVPFSAYLNFDDLNILSFSPERFLSFDNTTLLTSPIKGSMRRSMDPVIDAQYKDALLSCKKNRAENTMIVDLLRNDLGRIAKVGAVKVKHLWDIQSFAGIHHLVSHLEAEPAPEVSPLEAFKACFPGGSITGAPKLEAMRIIHENEKYARHVYCGCIGYFSIHGNFDFNIAIRTLTAHHGQLYMAAGGGIVIDSSWEDEYQECYTKIAAIKNAMSYE